MRILRDHFDCYLQEESVCYYLPRIIVCLYVLMLSSNKAFGHRRISYPLPTFNPTPNNFTYPRGELAILYCSIKHLGTRSVIWRRSSDPNPITIGTMTYMPDERYQVNHVPAKEEWNLFIKNVNPSDAGIYECQISTKEKNIRKLVSLSVTERPQRDKDIQMSGSTEVIKDGTIKILCNATGGTEAPGELDWLKDGRKLIPDNSRRISISREISLVTMTISSELTIQNVTPRDAGVYECRTSDLLVSTTTVTVEDAPVKRTIPNYGNTSHGTSCRLRAIHIINMAALVIYSYVMEVL